MILINDMHFILDSETVNSIIDLISKEKEGNDDNNSTDSPKLFNNFNISGFNISFNAGKQMQEKEKHDADKKKKSTVLQRRVARYESR